MTTSGRPLAGLSVGLSISECETSRQTGLPPWQVNRVALQFSAALLGQGARLVFGHDWRDDGVMEAVYAFARQMQPADTADTPDAPTERPLMRNILPWPDTPKLAPKELETLQSTLRVEAAGLPQELLNRDGSASKEHDPAYLRARGLTWLRRKLDEACNVRVCVGGRETGYSGRYAGIVEEAAIALERKTPLYLVGALGGAAATLTRAVRGEPMPADFCDNPAVARLYDNAPLGREANGAADRACRPRGVWDAFREFGIDRLSRLNALTVEENLELFDTAVIDRSIQLVLKGLAGVHRRRETTS